MQLCLCLTACGREYGTDLMLQTSVELKNPMHYCSTMHICQLHILVFER